LSAAGGVRYTDTVPTTVDTVQDIIDEKLIIVSQSLKADSCYEDILDAIEEFFDSIFPYELHTLDVTHVELPGDGDFDFDTLTLDELLYLELDDLTLFELQVLGLA
jgi:hypothetical protein